MSGGPTFFTSDPVSSSGGSGLTNYISGGTFEGNSVGSFKTGNASLSGINPTGSISVGAASITQSVVSAGALVGNYSLQVVAVAAWSAGDGIFVPFTIDVDQKTRVQAISFAYQVTSGSSNCNFSGTSASTFAVGIYDVTNSAWVGVSPAQYSGFVGATGIANLQFQAASNSVSYQLFIFAQTVSAGAVTILLDNISVGPQLFGGYSGKPFNVQTFTSGSGTYIPSTGTTAIKVTIAGGGGGGGGAAAAGATAGGTGGNTTFGSILTASGGVGGNPTGFVQGGAGGTNTISGGTTLLNLVGGPGDGAANVANASGGPGGTNALGGAGGGGGGNGLVGVAAASNTGAGGGGAGAAGSYGSGSGGGAGGYIQSLIISPAASYSYSVGSAGSAGTGTSAGGAGGSGVVIIEEFGGGAIISQYDGRVVAVQITSTTNGQASPNGNPTIFPIVSYDSHNGYSTVTGLYTVPVSGIYTVGVSGVYVTSGGASFNIYKNGSNYGFVGTSVLSSSIVCTGSIDVKCNAGDTLSFVQNGSNNSLTYAAGGTQPFVSISLQSGSQQIQAGQTITASYTSATTSFASAGPNQVIFPTKSFDTTSSYNTGTGNFTAPVTGYYLAICARRWSAATYGAGAVQELYLYKNGSNTTILSRGNVENYTSAILGLNGSQIVFLNAGDTVSIYAYNNTVTSLDGNSATNYFSIKQI